MLSDLADQPEQRAVLRIRDVERELGVLLEGLRAQMEELLPAEPIERIYERAGVGPASAEQFEAFAAEHAIPLEGGG